MTPFLSFKLENDNPVKGKTKTENSADGSALFYFVKLDVFA